MASRKKSRQKKARGNIVIDNNTTIINKNSSDIFSSKISYLEEKNIKEKELLESEIRQLSQFILSDLESKIKQNKPLAVSRNKLTSTFDQLLRFLGGKKEDQPISDKYISTLYNAFNEAVNDTNYLSTRTELENAKLQRTLQYLENYLADTREINELHKQQRVQFKQARHLNEAKVLFVGQGEVGKTSLIKRLLNLDFDPIEPKTDGIDIRKWNVSVDGRNIRLNIWDFGGQEIMHATHQFFLTRRSLYVLVIAARKDEFQNNLEYWLKLIQSFGSNSPIIVVINKTEKIHVDLAKRSLQEKYPNIKRFVETSCKTGTGIQELKRAILEVLSNLEFVNDLVDERWMRVKRRLEKNEDDFMEYDKYQALCQEEGVSEPIQQKNLIRFLHDLGTVLNFGYSDTSERLDVRLENTNVLNPEWITQGVYAILNSNELGEQNGVIQLEQLDGILDKVKYPKEKQIYIIEMMKKFELCFELDGERDKFLVVAGNLTKDEPNIAKWVTGNSLKFEYHYNFLPGSVISRFIVRMYQHRIENLYWRTGIAISFDENDALIKADLTDNRIFVYVSGNNKRRRELLAIIRSELKRINSSISQLVAIEKIPYKGVLLEYDELIGYEEMGIKTIPIPRLKEIAKVRDILATIESSDHNRIIGGRNMIKNNPWKAGSFYLVAFVVVAVVLALIGIYVSWIAVPVVLIAALLAITVIGAMQLRNDVRLKDESFVKLIIEFYKRLPLLRKSH
jgi:internalin A